MVRSDENHAILAVLRMYRPDLAAHLENLRPMITVHGVMPLGKTRQVRLNSFTADDAKFLKSQRIQVDDPLVSPKDQQLLNLAFDYQLRYAEAEGVEARLKNWRETKQQAGCQRESQGVHKHIGIDRDGRSLRHAGAQESCQ